MPYTKTVWNTGDVLTAVKMNNLETQFDQAKAQILIDRANVLYTLAQQNLMFAEIQTGQGLVPTNPKGWSNEAFLTTMNNVQSMDAGLTVVRQNRLNQGYVTGFFDAGMSDTLTPFPDALGGLDSGTLVNGLGSIGIGKASNGDEYLLTQRRISPVAGEAVSYEALLYKRSAGTDAWTKLSNFWSSAPPVNGSMSAITWSPNGDYVAFWCASTTPSPSLYVYKRVGDLLTLLSGSPRTDNVGAANDLAWDPTSTFLFAATNLSPYIHWWKRTGDTFAKQTSPSGIAAAASSVAVDSTGGYVAVCEQNGGVGTGKVYKLDAATPSLSGSIALALAATSVCWAGTSLWAATGTFGFKGWSRAGDTFTAIAGLPANGSSAVGYNTQVLAASADGQHIFQGGDKSGGGKFCFNHWHRDPATNALTLVPLPNLATIDTRSFYVRRIVLTRDDSWVFLAGQPVSPETMDYYAYHGSRVNPAQVLGSLTLKTQVLDKVCNAIYIQDSVEETVGTSMYRDYSVSLNGGATWELIPEASVGTTVKLNHSGTQLIVKLNLRSTNPAMADKIRVYWITAYATLEA